MSQEVLSLYRAILRLGRNQLKLTDQEFFRRAVREEFRRNKEEKRPNEIAFQLQVRVFSQLYLLCTFILNRREDFS